ncbi:MAG: glycosyltransferase, partial [Phycisphaerales bacterium]|nr:glycosyltransferase [Phycisphaerales bacterium]
ASAFDGACRHRGIAYNSTALNPTPPRPLRSPQPGAAADGKPAPFETERGTGGAVSILVCTFRRPEGLTRLLESLGKLQWRRERPPRVEVVVVDNDPAGAAKPVCESARATCSLDIRYVKEPRHGIPYARNASVAAMAADATYCVFVDDDETVEPLWLDELLRVAEAERADVVAGRVEARFLAVAPKWVERGGFHQQTRFPTGATLDRAYTNNTLVCCEALRAMPALFDERMQFSGGSDTHFFRRMYRAGFRIVSADDAIVYDWFPESRMTARWIWQRAFRIGASSAFIERDFCGRWGAAPVCLAVGGYRVLKGIVTIPLGLLGFERFVRAVRHVCYGAGLISGWFGVKYGEYRRVHGE